MTTHGNGVKKELGAMATKWHINKNDKPAECEATIRPCPLGGAEVHYDSKAEAWKAIEQRHAADFVKGTGSLSKARAYQEKYGTDDPEVNSIVRAAIGKGVQAKVYKSPEAALLHKPGSARVVNVRTVATSKQTKAVIAELNVKYTNADLSRRGLASQGHYGAEYAATARSLENVSADAELLRARLLETIAGGSNRTFGDVMYVADVAWGDKNSLRDKNSHRGLLVQTAVQFDSEALAEDMASKGYDVRDVQDTHSSLSVSKLKKFISDTADSELGLSKGMRGAPALRAKYLEETGVFRTETTWSPDKKQIDALAHAHPSAVTGRMFTEEQVSKMSASQVRAALVAVGSHRDRLSDEMKARNNEFVKAGWRPADKNADGTATVRAHDAENPQNDGLTFKSRSSSVIADGSAAVAWVEDHGGYPSDFMTRRTFVKAEKLEAFTKQHPEVSYYKYAKPVQRVSFAAYRGRDDNMDMFA